MRNKSLPTCPCRPLVGITSSPSSPSPLASDLGLRRGLQNDSTNKNSARGAWAEQTVETAYESYDLPAW